MLLDEGLPRSIVKLLIAAGHEADHVADVGLRGASDETIMDRAAALRAIIVTHDADYHVLLAIRNASAPSVVRLRTSGLKADMLALLVLRALEAVGVTITTSGAAVSVDLRRIRIHRLPFRPSGAERADLANPQDPP